MLEGAWRIVSEVSAGIPNPDAADNSYWFHSDRVVVGSQECAWDWPAWIGPQVIDMWSDNPAYPFQDCGIWERRGDHLWLCWGVPGSGERPAAFASTLTNGWQLVVLEPSNEPEPT